MISSMAKVIATIPVDGVILGCFLSSIVQTYPLGDLALLQRPFHIFGIRLGMPPFQLQVPPKGKSRRKS